MGGVYFVVALVVNASVALLEVFISALIASALSWTGFLETDPELNRSDLPILIHWV